MKEGQELEIKLTLKCLENVKNREQTQEEKEKVGLVIKKVEKSRDKRDLKGLNEQQILLFNLLLDGFRSYKQTFSELLKQQKYRSIAGSSFDVNDFLLTLQPVLNIDKSNTNTQNMFSKYTVQLLKLKKPEYGFPKEVGSEWTSKAKEKMADIIRKRDSIKLASLNQPQSEQYEESEEIESEEQPTPPPRLSINREKERQIQRERERQREREKEKEKERQREKQKERERERERERQREKERERQIDRDYEDKKGRRATDQKNEPNQQSKNKVYAMEKYLQSRKDLHFGSTKIREVAEYLSANLQQFMRESINKIYNIAKVKNKKNAKLGNQLGYFSQENDRLNARIQRGFHIQPNSKIFDLSYKHRLQFYTTLRAKEFKKEEQLRSALEAKTNESDKKIDKKIETYILKPRPKEVEPIVIYHDEKDQTKSNTLGINLQHLLYFLQTHPYLRNSQLLFHAYYN